MALTNHFDLILLLHLACYILEYEISQSGQSTYSVLNSMCCKGHPGGAGGSVLTSQSADCCLGFTEPPLSVPITEPSKAMVCGALPFGHCK